MKTLALTFIALTVSLISNAQQAVDSLSTTTINVAVPNCHNSDGQMMYALYTEADFLVRKPFKSAIATIEEGSSHAVFTDVPPGIYAIVVLHDENKNNKMDFDTNGMPLEYYGTSNNDMTLGPPSFEASKFEVGNDSKTLDFTIKL
ncbi:DUF2141 domain-containing protein [Robertkochia solimangrovi]|uniref:DUF2141 domain-containing protein n=1 Tax=Robertkochia solimangrovi TaxID=2213046 RepID=UPI00117C2F64|nr:DUF2141 domain-containing protein [Robertkochia solimangrovi]TRZ45149.1 hypothetical protein DMZ48_05205 [Robertkochia solimangrovi]